MTASVVFDPLLPWPILAVLAAIVFVGVVLALWRGLRGWALRGMAGIVVLAALSGPSYQQEDREALSDIVILATDESASQNLSDRPDQTSRAIAAIEAGVAARTNTCLLYTSDAADE